MGKKITPTGVSGMLMRLRKDQGGNTIAIVGAALIPLTAMVGGGVDASRAYMVKARLQQACDAGVLAGRKAVGEGTFDTNAQDRADAFFKNNFPDGYQSTTETNFTVGSNDGGTTVTGTATTTLPTVIMGLFAEDEDDSYETQKSKKRIQDRAEARTGVKNSLMTTQSIDLTVSCNAKLEVTNSDIMMVLDNTGSMACPDDADTAGCSTYINSYGTVEGQNNTTSRMAALKSAMIDFNEILGQAASGTTARIRYGFVPFSSTVNVGKLLYAQDSDYLMGGSGGDSVTYQSRRAVYKKILSTSVETMQYKLGSTTFSAWNVKANCDGNTDRYPSNSSSGTAIRYGTSTSSTTAATWLPSNGSNNGYGNNEPTQKSGDSVNYYEFDAITSGTDQWTFAFTTGGVNYGRCKRKATRFQYTYDANDNDAVFSHYEYRPLSWDVSDYVDTGINGGTITDPSDNQKNNPNQVSWAGCIQERETVSEAAFDYDTTSETITPEDATDMDIDSAPSSDETRWSPLWPEVAYYRTDNSGNFLDNAIPTLYGDSSFSACPAEARLFSEMSATEFAIYTNSLNPVGSTYHDIGAIWGARLASPDGIFADNVLEEPDNQSFVGRHMIFLTDGQLQPSYLSNTAYGIEYHDRRVTDDGYTDQTERHLARFAAMCNAIKGKGIRIWVVSFGTELSTSLSSCASSSASVYEASDSEELTDAFVAIAESVADLRLSQ